MKWAEFSDTEVIQILRSCSNKKGDRCSSCPAFGKGDYRCAKHVMQEAAKRLEKCVKKELDV